jgi:hypothetical protein
METRNSCRIFLRCVHTGKRWLGILGRKWEVNEKMRYGVSDGLHAV